MTDQELIAYYGNLLAIQYKTLPNAMGTIEAVATEAVASQVFSQVLNGFDLATAEGEQLDILASYVGAPRTVFGYNPTVPYLSFPGYSDLPDPPTAPIGFAQYADTADPVTFWLRYSTSQTTYVLTDGQLRLLVAYLIAVHASDHTLYSIDVILQEFFGGYCTLADNEDMSITYTHQSSDPNLLFSVVSQLNLLPRPGGVEVVVVEV